MVSAQEEHYSAKIRDFFVFTGNLYQTILEKCISQNNACIDESIHHGITINVPLHSAAGTSTSIPTQNIIDFWLENVSMA